LDGIILQIQSLSYGTERTRLIQKANKILLDEVPWVFLWHKGSYNITQGSVTGHRNKLVFNAERFLSLAKKNG
jgi:ABC-type transport system substrate-binding protein